MSFGSFEGGSPQPLAEINTTPLVDVMLVLLVIFIITAPLFQQAVPLDLPRVDSRRLDARAQTIRLALNAEGRIFLDGQPASRAEAQARFAAFAPAAEVHLYADRATRYEAIAAILADAQAAGLTKIAFVTVPPQP